MRRTIFAALCAALFVGCGSSSAPPGASRSLPATPPQPTTTRLESARTPEGARGANKSHYWNGPIRRALIGGQIHIDTAGLRLIEGFEEVRKALYCPYWDAYGSVWTRGFGETDWSGNFGGVCINLARAEGNLAYLIENSYLPAVRNLGTNFNHHQIDALASFDYNLGAGIFTGSLRYSIQHHNPYPMLAYDRAGGVVLAGLARRRREEVALFLTPERAPVVETAAQKRARLYADYRRRSVLRRVLASYGCRRRVKHHQRLGPTCRRWFHEGDVRNAQIARLHREGIR